MIGDRPLNSKTIVVFVTFTCASAAGILRSREGFSISKVPFDFAYQYVGENSSENVDPLVSEIVASPREIATAGVIRVIGDRLWVLDLGGDPWLHAFDLTSAQIIYSGFQRGGGYNQFIQPRRFGAVPEETDSLWVWDAATGYMSIITLNDGQGASTARHLPLSSEAPYTARVSWINPDRIVGVSYTDSTRFVIFDREGTVVMTQSYAHPGSPEGIALSKRRAAAGVLNFVCPRPSGDGFIITYGNDNRVEIYDADAVMIRSRSVPHPLNIDETVYTEGTTDVTNHIWHVGCLTVNRYTLSLVSGRSKDDYSGGEAGAAEFVYIYNENGDLMKVVELDRPITSLAWDQQNRLLYGMSYLNSNILRFRISPALHDLLMGSRE